MACFKEGGGVLEAILNNILWALRFIGFWVMVFTIVYVWRRKWPM